MLSCHKQVDRKKCKIMTQKECSVEYWPGGVSPTHLPDPPGLSFPDSCCHGPTSHLGPSGSQRNGLLFPLKLQSPVTVVSHRHASCVPKPSPSFSLRKPEVPGACCLYYHQMYDLVKSSPHKTLALTFSNKSTQSAPCIVHPGSGVSVIPKGRKLTLQM